MTVVAVIPTESPEVSLESLAFATQVRARASESQS